MANLALRARMAHQGGSLAIAENSGTRRASEVGGILLVTFLLLLTEK